MGSGKNLILAIILNASVAPRKKAVDRLHLWMKASCRLRECSTSIGDPTYSSYYSGSVNLKKKKAKIKWKGGRGWPIKKLNCRQCEQIGRFIRLWASFKILWQQLICPNLSHSYAIFVNVSKSIIFQSEIIFGQLF